MLYRTFGRTGWLVSEISFGGWQLGGQWGKVDDRESLATLLASYESGVNFVDTAQMYGDGHSETVVGTSMREWRGDRVRVATKVQPTEWPSADDYDPDLDSRYPAKHLRDNVDNSLRRLGVDRLDLFQLHCWAPSGMAQTDWLETLHDLRKAGKIDKIGVSLRDYRPQDGVALARSGIVDSIQVIYNIFEQRPEEDLFPAAVAGSTAIIARVALDSGALSGAWNRDTYSKWEKGSVLHSMFRGERFAETLDRVDRLALVTSSRYSTLAEASVRFVLDAPAVSTTIIGMRNSQRLAETLSYSDGERLPSALRQSLAEHVWPRNYYR